VTRNDPEGCRGSHHDDRDRQRRVTQLCADSDDRARSKESESRRNGQDANLSDQIRHGSGHRKKEDEAHRGSRTTGSGGRSSMMPVVISFAGVGGTRIHSWFWSAPRAQYAAS